MRKKLKLFLGISYLLTLFIFLYFVFLQIEVSRLNDFSYYKELQVNIDNFIGENFYINLLIFFLFSVVWTALLGFGSPLLIMSGILFGKWVGTIISIISITLGATILYMIANFFFKDLINKLLKKKFLNYINLFKKNEFYYFFIFRFIGGLGLPFPLQNVLPVIFNMKKINYFFSSILGLAPGIFLMNTIGAGITKFIKETDKFSFVNLILSKEIYLPLIMFIILILLSLVIKKIFFDVRNK
jgi:uncharacterized membrane protein YdjX (TVP38/TMEM64 family)